MMQTIQCPVCIKAISRVEWPEHVAWHQPVRQQWHDHPRLGYGMHMHPGGEDPAHAHPLTVPAPRFER